MERNRDGTGPEHDAATADAVGPALPVVLDTLAPAERLAFVRHDPSGMPFDEIAVILGRSSDAARRLASRARWRVRGAWWTREADLERQRAVVYAVLRASRGGGVAALLTVRGPAVVMGADFAAADGKVTAIAPVADLERLDLLDVGLLPRRRQ